MTKCPQCGYYIKHGRSKGLRGYYFSVIVPAYAEAMGEEDLDLVNEWLKLKFNPRIETVNTENDELVGEVIKFGASIEKETIPRIVELYEQMRAFAMNFYGINIPEPNEVPHIADSLCATT